MQIACWEGGNIPYRVNVCCTPLLLGASGGGKESRGSLFPFPRHRRGAHHVPLLAVAE